MASLDRVLSLNDEDEEDVEEDDINVDEDGHNCLLTTEQDRSPRQ